MGSFIQYQRIKKQKSLPKVLEGFRDPAGVRTQDPLIKSEMLYQLSYGILQSALAMFLARLGMQK